MTKDKWWSVLKGAAIASAGAVLTALTAYLTAQDFGPWTAPIMAVWSVIVNAARLYLTPEAK